MPSRRRYPIVDQHVTIDLRLNSLEQLYDHLDPSPLVERDLDHNIADYLVESLEEISAKEKVQIRLYLKTPSSTQGVHTARQAMRQYFEFEGEASSKKLKAIFRKGRKALLIGLSFLSFTTALSHTFEATGLWSSITKEGLALLGWVAMWYPVNIFLYDWWPIVDRRKIFQKLSEVRIRVHQTVSENR